MLYGISITFRDEGNDSSTMQLYVDVADETAAVVRATAVAQQLDVMVGVQITAVQVFRNLGIGAMGLKGAPLAEYDVEKGVRLIFGTDFVGVNPYITIPGVLIFSATSDGQGGFYRMMTAEGNINPAAEEWDALVEDELITQPYADYRGADFLTLRENYEVFYGKRRNG